MARLLKIVAVAGVFLLAACGSDDDGGDASSDDGSSETTAAADESSDDGGDEGNACPVDGCTITISEVTATDSGELEVTWETNFDPDVSRNHVHVYWNTYTPEQVSNDAETTHEVEQGQWVPTDADPTYVTAEAVSVEVRDEADQICVTAADRDHNVLDVETQDCFDITDLVS